MWEVCFQLAINLDLISPKFILQNQFPNNYLPIISTSITFSNFIHFKNLANPLTSEIDQFKGKYLQYLFM